jgi:hypothetical protein
MVHRLLLFIPDFMDKYAAHAVDQLKESGASAAEIQVKKL